MVPLVGRTKQPLLPKEHTDTVDGMEALWESTIALSMTSGVLPEPSSTGLFLQGLLGPVEGMSPVYCALPAQMVAGALKCMHVEENEVGPS